MPIRAAHDQTGPVKLPFHEFQLEKLGQNAEKDDGRRVALEDARSGACLTYKELLELVNKVAVFLDNNGLKKADVVLVCLPNCLEYLPICYGIISRGGIPSGVNPNFTHYEIERQITDCDSAIVFCADFLLDRVLRAAADKNVQQIIALSLSAPAEESDKLPPKVIDFEQIRKCSTNFELAKVEICAEDDVALLPYSSGTSGVPKGVMLTHQNLSTLLATATRRLTKTYEELDWTAETQLTFLPMFHVFGFMMNSLHLHYGTKTIVISKFEPDVFLKTIQENKIRLLQVVPPIAVFLAKHPIIDKFDISSVEYIICGAAPLGKDICDTLMKRHSHLKFLSQGYGMTEMSMACCFPVLRDDRFGNAGSLLANFDIKVIDMDSGVELEPGQKGELCVRGPMVMKGYYKHPEKTAQTVDGDGWLHSGDVAYYDEESLIYIVDRLKELIKVKGLQVAPAELEDIILSHSSVADVAVIGIADGRCGEVPKAFVVLKAGVSVEQTEETDIQQYVAERVADFKQLKGGVEFVKEIPKSPSGKILRRLLRN